MEVKGHDQVRASNNSDSGWVNNGIGVETLTEVTKSPIVFPLQRQKSRDVMKNTLDVEVSPKIPAPTVPQTQRMLR